MVNFEDDEAQQERDIDAKTREITEVFHHAVYYHYSDHYYRYVQCLFDLRLQTPYIHILNYKIFILLFVGRNS